MNTHNTSKRTPTKRAAALLLAFFSILLFSNSLKAQHVECASDKYFQERSVLDPGLKARVEAIRSKIKLTTSSSPLGRVATSVITIPVVVHVVYNTAAQNISDAQIQSQIDVLNEDYSRSNADSVNTPGVFQPLAANTAIRFVLAKQDPNGNACTGITRTATAQTSFTTNNYVKFDSYGGTNAWNTTQYLNVWVCNLSGYGGYSAMPGEPASTDGVVINYLCFGRIGTLMSTRNKGRATTHEIGHWLGLAHTWGWSTCGDDAIADTPTQEKANSGIPVFPHLSSCSPNANGDMFMDFMDYSDDAALNMFTIDQATEMNATLHGYRVSLLTSLGGVAPGTTICNIPTGLSASSVTTSGATLSWASTGASSYSIRYKPTASATWITSNSSGNSLAISALTAGTSYEFQVASVCSGSSSAFSGSATFTTSTLQNTSVTIGSSNIGMSAAPYGTSYAKEHAQFIITKSELVAAGYSSVNNIIRSLSFFVNTASAQSLNNFTIKIAHTAASSFTSSYFLSTSAATTVYNSTFLTSASLWNKHAFTTPFTYDGTDNLLIDITWSNSAGSTSSVVNSTGYATNQALYYGTTNRKTNLGHITSGTLSLNRPNMQIEFAAPAARSASAGLSDPAIEKTQIGMELYPNPVGSVMNISLAGVQEAKPVRISIFNLSGALVAKHEFISEGPGQVISLAFNSSGQLPNLSDGMYICVIDVQESRVMKKFILSKN